MLDGARNAAGDIEVRPDRLPGLSHLVLIGDVAGVDRGPAGAEGCAECAGQFANQLKALLRILGHTAAA